MPVICLIRGLVYVLRSGDWLIYWGFGWPFPS